jgi:hypothetical protein
LNLAMTAWTSRIAGRSPLVLASTMSRARCFMKPSQSRTSSLDLARHELSMSL